MGEGDGEGGLSGGVGREMGREARGGDAGAEAGAGSFGGGGRAGGCSETRWRGVGRVRDAEEWAISKRPTREAAGLSGRRLGDGVSGEWDCMVKR